ncbi:gephyrin-like molybdotransferase Glp [Caulobacter mirabilis]|uniref:Molybdopterin molybdenumtransferase n=1 Tax=Caulobacter mirabilis TaxID=69666 RepID=A0A2D2ATZ3_9CAUL|nr:gephyrin-like molybdotransferase Glp [Caulobacter mirabilis]ATQ41466.1 molybdopterin molybdenumtransferase MoeA [Caulobacter mirabilis]
MSSNAPSSADADRTLKGLSVEKARARMLARAVALSAETAPLSDADGRVLAESVTAVRDQPPFAASAMDGWAVRRGDLGSDGAVLSIVGESAAGRGYDAVLRAGETVRIFTGAPAPDGSDLIVIQEEAERDGDTLRVGPAGRSSHLRPRGGDFRAGDVLLEAGTRLDPWRLSLAAAAGRATLAVARRPKVAVLATGEELAAPGGEAGPYQIYESGSAALLPMLARWGAAPTRLAPAGDDIDAIVAAVRNVEAEVIVTVGGASVGDYDLVKPAMAQLGLALDVETVNVRPGKPTWFGRLADGRLVLGLPGNPASAFVCAELFLKPLVLALQGAAAPHRLSTARLAAPLPANGPREHWMRARTTAEGVVPFPDQDSSLVTVFAAADCLLRRLPGAEAAEVGDTVDVLPLERG